MLEVLIALYDNAISLSVSGKDIKTCPRKDEMLELTGMADNYQQLTC
jgi:hypothetical protein